MKKMYIILVLLLAVSVFGGCSKPGDSSSTSAADSADNKNLTIVTSFYPMYISTINVTRDIDFVEVINLTKPQTGCLHDYQLTPQDLITLERADAFVVNGAGMETFLDDVVSRQKNLKIVEASKGIELLKDPSGETNTHVWVSITNAITQVRNIAQQLSEIDKANAEKYEINADNYIAKLEALRTKMHSALDNVESKDIITFHEAFPYFAKEFNLDIVAIIEREPGTAPTPKEIEETITIVEDAEVKALFAEPQYPVSAAQTIAAETGAKIYFLDPIVTGEANANAYSAYIETMEANLATLLDALG